MPTTNPVPSTDPTDLLFNAGKLDEVVNGTSNSFTDRLGVARRTVAGMNADFDAQLADAESDLNVYRADAAASAAEALGYLQTIRATSYGAYASDPATDPLGNPPTVGDEYFNTTANLLKRWNGSTWQASDINTANLAASSGSSLVGYDGGTVQDVLDGAKSLQDYAALRAFAGRANRVYITGLLVNAKPAGISGVFQYDPTDTTSADNGGTIIVGADGRRWKRDFNGHVMASWFGAIGLASTNEAPALNASISYCVAKKKSLFLNDGTYLLANTELLITGQIKIIGESEAGTVIQAAKADLSRPDGVSGYTNVFSVINSTVDAKIHFETITIDGGDLTVYKPVGKVFAKGVNLWRIGVPVTTIKKLSFSNVTIRNCTSEGASGNNYGSNLTKIVEYTEYINCTFSSIALSCCNVSGAQRIFNCKFLDLAHVEHAHHRGDGFLEIIDCYFKNTARREGSMVSVLNEKSPMTPDDYASRTGTRLTIKGCTFDNDKAWFDNWGALSYFQGIGVYGTGIVEIEDNTFRNCGYGESFGGGVIDIRDYNDKVFIRNNKIIAADSGYICQFVNRGYTSDSKPNLLDVSGNETISEYPLNATLNLFGTKNNPAPTRFKTKNNFINVQSDIAFTSAAGNVASIRLPVRRAFNVRVIAKIVTSAPTIINITNSSLQLLKAVYNGTPAVGDLHVITTFETDQINTNQWIGEYVIRQSGDPTNTFNIYIEEV